jgi:hypothetical protein
MDDMTTEEQFTEEALDFLEKTFGGFPDPDDLYKEYGKGSTTFYYYKGHYKEAAYPAFHKMLIRKDRAMWATVLKKLARMGQREIDEDFIDRDEFIWAGILLGRVARVGNFDLIAFWNPKINEQELYECVHEVVANHPELTQAPEKTVVFSATSHDVPARTLLDFGFRPSGKPVERPQDARSDPECDKIRPVIDGRPTSLGTMIGDLHMVRGDRAAKVAAQFCGQSSQLKSHAERLGCKTAGEYLSHLDQQYKCSKDPKQQYADALRAGRLDRKQWLRDVFADPAKMDREFRTQREIDAAWGELRGEWLRFGDFLRPAINEWLQRRAAMAR